MKLMGFQGSRGDPGLPGPVGPPGRCNCTFPNMYVHRIPIPGPPVIQVEEKMVPVPVVVVKEVEVTRLVPFEPTPPGFGPPPGWSPGMPKPDLSENGTLLFGNFTDTWGNYTNFTTPEPYTGPPTLGYNRRECMLAAVGIPVLHAESQYGEVGSWMRDAHPQSDYMAEKRWVTDGYASPVLYEYENERQMMNKVQNIKYYVDYLASGTGNLIYNGSYYYHKHGSTALVRYDLETTDQIEAELGDIAHRDCGRLPDHTFEDCNETERHPWLYSRPHNYVDFAADENGLWVIYMRPDSYSLYVSKIEPDFYIVDTWEVPDVNGTELADAFIMCGVLYGLQSATTRDSRISLAYDLFSNETIPGQVAWYNPYQGLTMLHYNPVDSRLYFFDDRRLLSVNVRMDDDEPDYEN
uniref:Olfactomedin-like domain-containing protein n=1 Tax=Angiostrongylus cantonensis TaxID=6313 RepID=A0A158P5W8_ANGCA